MSTAPEPIAQLNERFAIVDIGSHKRDTVVVELTGDGDLECLREFAAFERHLRQQPPINLGQGPEPLAQAWLDHPDARRYRSLVFAPAGSPTSVGPNDYNTWRGFAVEPSAGDWTLNRFHIDDVICGGNEKSAHWLHNWLAAMFQRPGEHGWVAPVLKGGQGIGKGFFADWQIGQMFRRRNYAHLTDPMHLTGNFNAHLEDRVLVFADEAFWGDRRAANKLKGLITEGDILINRKHVPQEIQRSALHIIIASNADRPLPVERDDRRLFVLQVSEDYKSHHAYFSQLKAELEAGGRAAMLDYFLNYDVDWSILKSPPDTKAKQEMKAESLSAEDEWWREVLDNATEASWKTWEKVGCSKATEHYASWFDKYRRREQRKNARGLGQYFARLFERGGMKDWPQVAKVGSRNSRENAWRFPSLANCRAVFDQATGTQSDWAG